jgi:hypothetical protein
MRRLVGGGVIDNQNQAFASNRFSLIQDAVVKRILDLLSTSLRLLSAVFAGDIEASLGKVVLNGWDWLTCGCVSSHCVNEDQTTH